MFRFTKQFFIAVLLMALLPACVEIIKKKDDEKIYWPKFPDPPRYVYETTLRSEDSIHIATQEDIVKRALVGENQKAKKQTFSKPYDIAARGGKIVVTDTVNRIALMFDVPNQKVYPFGYRGDGILKKPLGVAMDEKQWIYIADVSEKNVKIYDSLGLHIKTIGGESFFERPVDVAVTNSGDRIYVVDAGGIDTDRHQVLMFDSEGNLVKTIGTRGAKHGQFNLPSQAAVTHDGTLYILDAGNFRVQSFTADGEFITTWGKVGRSFGQFARPRGLAVDNKNNVYVTDAAFRNFQIFSPEGDLLMFIGEQELDDKPGHFVLPAGITVDETGRVYIVDQLALKIDVIRQLTQNEIDRIIQERSKPMSTSSSSPRQQTIK